MIYYDFGYKTLDQIADFINNSPVRGFKSHTPEWLAAAYAIGAQFEQGHEICEDSAGVHFDALEEAGAKFERSEALKLALSQSNSLKQALAE